MRIIMMHLPLYSVCKEFLMFANYQTQYAKSTAFINKKGGSRFRAPSNKTERLTLHSNAVFGSMPMNPSKHIVVNEAG